MWCICTGMIHRARTGGVLLTVIAALSLASCSSGGEPNAASKAAGQHTSGQSVASSADSAAEDDSVLATEAEDPDADGHSPIVTPLGKAARWDQPADFTSNRTRPVAITVTAVSCGKYTKLVDPYTDDGWTPLPGMKLCTIQGTVKNLGNEPNENAMNIHPYITTTDGKTFSMSDESGPHDDTTATSAVAEKLGPEYSDVSTASGSSPAKNPGQTSKWVLAMSIPKDAKPAYMPLVSNLLGYTLDDATVTFKLT